MNGMWGYGKSTRTWLFFLGISTIQETKKKYSESTNSGKLLLTKKDIIFTCDRRKYEYS